MTDEERITLIIETVRNLYSKYNAINLYDPSSTHCSIKPAAAMSKATLQALVANHPSSWMIIDYHHNQIDGSIVKTKLMSTIPLGWTRPPNMLTIDGYPIYIRTVLIVNGWIYLVEEDLPLGKVVARAWDGIAQCWLPENP